MEKYFFKKSKGKNKQYCATYKVFRKIDKYIKSKMKSS